MVFHAVFMVKGILVGSVPIDMTQYANRMCLVIVHCVCGGRLKWEPLPPVAYVDTHTHSRTSRTQRLIRLFLQLKYFYVESQHTHNEWRWTGGGRGANTGRHKTLFVCEEPRTTSATRESRLSLCVSSTYIPAASNVPIKSRSIDVVVVVWLLLPPSSSVIYAKSIDDDG